MIDAFADKKKVDLIVGKPLAEMSIADKQAIMVDIGLPALPYPMVYETEDEKGEPIVEIGIVDPSSSVPFAIPSIYGPERINGELYRFMPTPQTMPLFKRMVERAQPDQKNRLISVFGDSGSGKSYTIMKFAELLHPEGALRVDCGGMNMHELFFRTIIDYGKGVKESFESSLKMGRISKGSISEINEAFPDAIIEKDGVFDINWNLIGEPKRDKETNRQLEDYQTANSRAKELLKKIYEREGISTKSNAFGIKTVPGVIIECERSGRPLLLDEFNKCKRGTLDTFQAYLELARGDIDSITLPNKLATSDSDPDCPRDITLERKNRKASFQIYVSGNEAKDGDSSQEIATSMGNRLDTIWISKANPNDWKHRISQAMGGVPIYTLHALAQGQINDANADQFGEWLCHVREDLGVTVTEKKAVPAYQGMALRKYKSTLAATNMVGDFCYYMQRLVDPESDLYAPNRRAVDVNNKKPGEVATPIDPNVINEVSAHGRKMNIGLRTVVDMCRSSTSGKIKATNISAARFDFALRDQFKKRVTEYRPGWVDYGTNMQQVLREFIFNATNDMPAVRKHLMEVGKELGVFKKALNESKTTEARTLDELMRFDDDNSTPEERHIRTMLCDVLRSRHPELREAPMDMLVTKEKISEAVRKINKDVPVVNDPAPRTDASKEADPKNYTFVTVSADKDTVNGQTPVDVAYVFPAMLEPDPSNKKVRFLPMDYRSFLLGLVLPQYGVSNRETIWPTDIATSGFVDVKSNPEYKEALNMLAGLSQFGINMNVIIVGDDSDKKTEIILIEDANNKRLLAICDKPLPTEILSELNNGGITYIQMGDANGSEVYNKFLSAAVEKKLNSLSNQRTAMEQTGQVGQHLARAYMMTVNGGKISVKEKETVYDLMCRANGKTHPRRIFSAAVVKRISSEEGVVTDKRPTAKAAGLNA